MNRGDDRRVDQIAVGERQEVEAVVDQVELCGSFEHRRDVKRLPDLRRQPRILGVSVGAVATRRAPVIESAVANSVNRPPGEPGPRSGATRTAPTVRSDAGGRATKSAPTSLRAARRARRWRAQPARSPTLPSGLTQTRHPLGCRLFARRREPRSPGSIHRRAARAGRSGNELRDRKPVSPSWTESAADPCSTCQLVDARSQSVRSGRPFVLLVDSKDTSTPQ